MADILCLYIRRRYVSRTLAFEEWGHTLDKLADKGNTSSITEPVGKGGSRGPTFGQLVSMLEFGLPRSEEMPDGHHRAKSSEASPPNLAQIETRSGQVSMQRYFVRENGESGIRLPAK